MVFMALWEAAVRIGAMRYEYLPAPTAALTALAELAQEGMLLGEILHTVGVALIGWTVAVAIGVLFGAALGISSTLRTYSLTTIELLRPLPAVALVPVGLLLFGFSAKTELFVIIIPSVWPVLVNTMAGIMTVPARLRDVAQSMRLRVLEVILKVYIPAAAPAILVGCRLSMSIALVLAIVAEMIGNPEGLGNAVVREAQALNPGAMFAYVFLTGLLGILLNALLVGLSRVLLPGEFRRPVATGGRA